MSAHNVNHILTTDQREQLEVLTEAHADLREQLEVLVARWEDASLRHFDDANDHAGTPNGMVAITQSQAVRSCIGDLRSILNEKGGE